MGFECAHLSFSLATPCLSLLAGCLGVGCVCVGRLSLPIACALSSSLFPCPSSTDLAGGGLLCSGLCIPLSVLSLVTLESISSVCLSDVGYADCICCVCNVTLLTRLELTSGYCFRFFCSFANKVALTKADLQGREGSCTTLE